MQNQPTSLTPMVVLSTHRQECLLKPDGVSSGRPRIIKKRGGLLEELCHIALCVRPGSANARTDVSDSTSNCNRLPHPLENNACSRLTCGSVTCDTLGIAHRGAVDQIRFKILWISEVSEMCSKPYRKRKTLGESSVAADNAALKINECERRVLEGKVEERQTSFGIVGRTGFRYRFPPKTRASPR